jgi:transcriptional regulator with GAF, ATPase, and Fis domain
MTQQDAWDEVAASIAGLQKALLSTETVEEFLRELVTQAARLVAGGLSCGMTLGSQQRAFTVACSDEIAAEVDEAQYALGTGPCLESMRSGVPVRVDDTRADRRWAQVTQRAAELGVRSVLALPLAVDGEPAGALNLYAPAPDAFGEPETRRAEQFAEHGSGALALASRLASYAALTGQLRASLASRAVIDQAVGVIMAQERCTQAKAFAILRTASQHRNIKLRELAGEIVTSVSGEPPAPPPFG